MADDLAGGGVDDADVVAADAWSLPETALPIAQHLWGAIVAAPLCCLVATENRMMATIGQHEPRG